MRPCWKNVPPALLSPRLVPIAAAGLALVAAGACAPPPNETGEAFTRNGQIIAMGGGEGGPGVACFTCHGLRGEGDGVATPRLAGLDAGYLQKQMEDYAADVRQAPVMSEVARWLDDSDRRAVAAWYASLPPASATASGKPAPPTPVIYLQGAPGRGVPACAVCHGVAGEGVGPGNPALAGQPATYTVDQLERWRTSKRRNDPRNVMSRAVAGLTSAEIREIALWLEALPASRPPDSDVASASAAASATAEPAASRGKRRPDR